MTLGVVLFVLGIAVSILLHEAGHLVTAKAFGMKATQFFAGFGPTLWSFRRGETEYGVKAIPAGGFVKIVGMTQLEDVAAQDAPRAFWRFSAPRRFVVLVAGSVTHFILAFVVLYGMVVATGLPTDRPAIGAVSSCLPRSITVANPNPPCSAADPVAPARLAGLRSGDELIALDGRRIRNDADAFVAIRTHPPGPAQVTVRRDGGEVTTTVRLVQVERPRLDDPTKTERVSAMGIGIERVVEHPGPLGAVVGAGRLVGQLVEGSLSAMAQLPSRLPKLWDAVMGAERDPNTPISVVGASRLGGQALAAQETRSWLGIFAGLNIFIGIFNLLPLLPLDGGHVAILLFEQARSRLARLLGRRDPGRVDITKLLPLTYVVILLFGTLSVLALLADIVNPIANPFQ